ncbi:hypothetical protein [Clavibacter capsici]|uniref:hypothetical protein n=1 Tax=Clavibacter capsici TaxID=1874630 RepID=UPI00287B5D5C|nr:hypothetical protein [Clavibacter capsici]
MGAAWAAPAAAVAGDAGGALGMLLVAVASAALLALVWIRLVPWALTAPDRMGGGRAQTGLGWFGRFGASPAGRWPRAASPTGSATPATGPPSCSSRCSRSCCSSRS